MPLYDVILSDLSLETSLSTEIAILIVQFQNSVPVIANLTVTLNFGGR